MPLEGRSARQSTWDKSGGNIDSLRIPGGGTVTLFEAEGPGVIRHIWLTTTGAPPAGRSMVLRMWWDGSDTPAVEVPLGDFFAVGHGLEAEVHSFPVTVGCNGRARNCWWPMPFARGARITVTNEGEKRVGAFYCQVDWQALDGPPPTRERFYAQYRQAFPVVSPENYVILDTRGRGHYVGTVFNVESTEPGWWGEGDDLFEADGQEPLRGTGTEDYLCDAWGIRVGHELWYGTSLSEGFSTPGMRTTSYRWHILDPISFREHLRVSIEHGHANDRADNLSSVAFWYQVPPAALFPPLPPALKRIYGGATARDLPGFVTALALGNDSRAAPRIYALLPGADEIQTPLIRGMGAYARAKDTPTEAALGELDREIAVLSERTQTPNAAPAKASAEVEIVQSIERVRHDLQRRLARARGHLEPGDEILVEVRDSQGELTPSPTFESTKGWIRSTAKADDVHLIGRATQFTRGQIDPAWARFTPDLPQGGRYEVLVIFPPEANAGDTSYEVRHADGMEAFPLPQRGRPGTPGCNSGEWHSLGIHRFEAGQSPEHGSVTVTTEPGTPAPNEDFDYRAYADAVRFVFVGD